ncbi:MAG: InlB B-repeat-containing protein, partial [Clostridia bacterium]|nr:InlB B-repeat-containing protein [Clostridia bacterium]
MQYLYITYTMPKLGGRTIDVALQYGQPYSYKKIADMFQSEFKAYMLDPNFSSLFLGKSPAFVVDGATININDYRATTGNAYENVKDKISLTVDFVDAEYTVTFKPNNGDADRELPNKLKYNVPIPSQPNPTKPNEIFLGWYYDTGEVDSTTQKPIMEKWDFEEDRVTGDITLEAQWLAADKLESVTVTQVKDLYAGNEIQKGDLKVLAYFEGIEEGIPVDWEDYCDTLTYDSRSWDDRLHIFDKSNPQMKISLSYTFTNSKGESMTKNAECDVTVSAINMTTQAWQLDFGQDANREIFENVDGTAKNLKELDKSEYSGLFIDKITYEYRNATGGIIQPEDVKTAGRYTVRVKFEMTSNDYIANDLVITMILGELTEVTIVWDYDDSQPYMYDGKPQKPSAKVYRNNGTEITNIKITYEGDIEVSARGNYTIKAVLDSSVYKIVEGASCDFRIVKAVLDAPTLKDDTAIVYDGSEKRFENLFNIDTNLIEIASGGLGTDAGNYTAILSLKDTVNCEWSSTSGATGNTVQVKWTIEKAHLTAVWNG